MCAFIELFRKDFSSLLRTQICLGVVFDVLKGHLGLSWNDYQHAVIDEFLCMVAGFALGTGVCYWMFEKKVNMVQGQQDGYLR